MLKKVKVKTVLCEEVNCFATFVTKMAEYANAAKKMIPNIPSGGGGFLVAAVGLGAGAYGLYHSVVTGNIRMRCVLVV